ncbi:hydantoinase/oxoprolinase family protein [Pseudaminobacter sp. 19-2017]|uniref:Hydantoinase/oxoprolinase family protein n=1 Tax=Pseudaminobacter soli (ex Zhang et al. 2022) TaxID=2831468 RepID=A0A942E631_9HYPH|nr:hydantoinase/oxoprolinase family protein [Pseudaminobacter soli]MBS3651626.1 hydantoinase/oxoprolinase family protein [Pseudaminobacter soli]
MLDRPKAAACRVGIDIGGTFTDLVVVNDQGETFTKKVSSTADNYARAIIEGLAGVLEPAGLSVDRISEFLHGTTVGSNTILELKGARIGLIGTKGFRDILEIRNLRMPRLYDLRWDKPAPLVERYLRLTVNERVDATGAITTPLSRSEVEAAVQRLLAEKVEGIAVCLLNSYANPSHERLIAEVIRELAPDLPYSISSDVLPQMKEYERTSTTVVNAYIMPIVASYLKHLGDSLRNEGMKAPILLMQSNGGLTTAEEASEKPVNIVESGPAAGVVGAVRHAVNSGHSDIISFDMGGTTAKASVAENGQFVLSQQYSVGGGIMISSRLLTGGGYLLAVPAIDVAEVGAGGGSIVWIDAGGSMQIGPESAGANPGPVCYNKGGDRPTVTDANVILGYINPEYLVGGELKLDAARARNHFDRLLAKPLGVDVTTAAYGARQIAISNMIRAIKAVTSERGRDPRGFTLFALGGNGALFAAGMARELGIKSILVPPSAGLFSAYGLLHADVEHYYGETVRRLLRDIEPDTWLRSWSRLEDKARAQLSLDGFSEDEIHIRRFANMRYKGQTFEMNISLPDGPLTEASLATIEEAFGTEHERTYGHRASLDEPVQLISIQIAGLAARPGSAKPGKPQAHSGDLRAEQPPRKAYFGSEHGWLDTAIIPRSALTEPRRGPCIVEEYDTTCVIPPNATARLDAMSNIIITLE